MTLREFSKMVKVLKAHRVKNNFISVTYADRLSINTLSAEKTVLIENRGGALRSLYHAKSKEI